MLTSELREALEATGQSSLLAWAEQFPTLGMVELARRLPVQVAPITLVLALAEEAQQCAAFTSFARAWAVRVLNDRADASTWLYIFDDEQRPMSRELWRRIEEERAARPHWSPQDRDDSRLIELFADVDLSRTARTQRVVTAFERIDAVCGHTATNQAALEALAQLPAGYGYLHAVRWVNAEVCNGGFEQLFRNSGGVEVPLAIAGFVSLQRDDLAAIVRESLSYARARHPQLVDESVHATPAIPSPRTWARLDEAYYALPRDSLTESYATLIESMPQLFEPPFHELHHPSDGRRWKVRASGAVVEIQIELEDGTSVTRERKQGSSAAAEREMQQLREEQRREGFVKVK